MFQGKGCALGGLLGLPAGVEVELVERESDGSFTVHVVTTAEAGACCPGCGAASGRVKETVGHTVRHLVVAPVRVTWHKRRMACVNAGCGRGGFVEDTPLAVRGGRVSLAGLAAAGHLVGDWMVPVSRVAAVLGASWHTAHGGFVGVAAAAGIVAGEQGADPGCPDDDAAVPGSPEDDQATDTDRAGSRARRSVSGPLPPVEVLGLDDQRRGAARWHRDPASGRYVTDADQWQSVLIDSTGGHGLLGVVEGRAAAPVAHWISDQPAPWRAAVQAVTIDMSTVYRSAAHTALPGAMVAVDPFHVAQLGNRMVGDVRRRATHQRCGRRGRATDPEYTIKRLLLRGRATLTPTGRNRILTTLADLGGTACFEIGTAWRAKNLLLDLLALSPTRTGLATTRTDINRALTRFFEFAATIGATIPEVVTLAETISEWRVEITNAVLHGLSNAAAEGVNRLTKLVYRTAFGLRNVTNQQRRARYTASRSTRPNWLLSVTAHPKPA